MRSLFIVLMVLASCSASTSKRCEQVCRREAECIQSEGDPAVRFNSDECTTICTALERDKNAKLLVDQHVACVKNAGACDEILSCGDIK